MAGTVRLTIQIRDHENRVRVQERKDVPLSAVAETATKIANRAAKYFRKEEREAQAAQDETNR